MAQSNPCSVTTVSRSTPADNALHVPCSGYAASAAFIDGLKLQSNTTLAVAGGHIALGIVIGAISNRLCTGSFNLVDRVHASVSPMHKLGIYAKKLEQIEKTIQSLENYLKKKRGCGIEVPSDLLPPTLSKYKQVPIRNVEELNRICEQYVVFGTSSIPA
jgi:hypothetical protein